MNGNVSGISQYINASLFNGFEGSIRKVQNIIKKSKTPKLPVWMGEGADAWHSGTYNISDRYVSGFLCVTFLV